MIVIFLFCIRCGLLKTCRPTSSSLIGSACTCSGSAGKHTDVMPRSFCVCYTTYAMLSRILILIFFLPLLRQQADSDLDRRHRMKSEPLKPHISVYLTTKDVIILNFFVICGILRRRNSLVLVSVLWWCFSDKMKHVWLWKISYRREPEICAEELDVRVCYQESWDERFFWGVFTIFNLC